MRLEYEYAVLRLVPKVERCEYINIGVIFFCKRKRFAALKWQLDRERIHYLFGDVDFDLIESHLTSMKNICLGNKEGGKLAALEIAERVRWLTAHKSTIIQCSSVHVGECESPENTFGIIFREFVR